MAYIYDYSGSGKGVDVALETMLAVNSGDTRSSFQGSGVSDLFWGNGSETIYATFAVENGAKTTFEKVTSFGDIALLDIITDDNANIIDVIENYYAYDVGDFSAVPDEMIANSGHASFVDGLFEYVWDYDLEKKVANGAGSFLEFTGISGFDFPSEMLGDLSAIVYDDEVSAGWGIFYLIEDIAANLTQQLRDMYATSLADAGVVKLTGWADDNVGSPDFKLVFTPDAASIRTIGDLSLESQRGNDLAFNNVDLGYLGEFFDNTGEHFFQGSDIEVILTDQDDLFNDFYGMHSDSLSIDAGGGNDEIMLGLGPWIEAADYVSALDYNILGGAGDDQIWAKVERDGTFFADGGEGSDDIWVQAFSDAVFAGNKVSAVLHGGAGSDQLKGYLELRNELFGGDDDDTLTGGKAQDLFDGGAGDDIFWLGNNFRGAQADTAFGGNGDDEFMGENLRSAIYIDGGAGADKIDTGQGRDTVAGGSGNDKINSRGRVDVVDAGEGDDVVKAGGGDDTVTGGEGDDRLFGQNGHDSIDGGAGIDRVFGGGGNDDVSGGEGNDVVLGGGGGDTLSGDGGNDLLKAGTGSDMAFGGDGDDTVLGQAGHDTLGGGAGTDMLQGGKGRDVVEGNDGDDSIAGNAGRDTLNGGDGMDTLNGGIGNDLLTGGQGADRFTFLGRADEGRDVISDFELGIDILQVRGITFDRLDIGGFSGGADTRIILAGGTKIILEGIAAADIAETSFDFI